MSLLLIKVDLTGGDNMSECVVKAKAGQDTICTPTLSPVLSRGLNCLIVGSREFSASQILTGEIFLFDVFKS